MRIGDQMQEKQCAVVQAFGIASRDSDSTVDAYLAEALHVHMLEAIGSHPLPDKQTAAWLDINEFPLTAWKNSKSLKQYLTSQSYREFQL